MIRICGFDPGTLVCGYGVIDFEPRTQGLVLVECGTLEPGSGSVQQRLDVLGRDAAELIREFKPAAAGLEHAYFGINPQSALRISEARGVLLRVCGEAGVPVEQYQPSSAKLSVAGSGRATKEQVRAVVMRALHLASPPKLDASDALAIAICRARRWRMAS